MKDVTYDNIKSRKKPGLHPFSRRCVFKKTTGKSQIALRPTASRLRVNYLFCVTSPLHKFSYQLLVICSFLIANKCCKLIYIQIYRTWNMIWNGKTSFKKINILLNFKLFTVCIYIYIYIYIYGIHGNNKKLHIHLEQNISAIAFFCCFGHRVTNVNCFTATYKFTMKFNNFIIYIYISIYLYQSRMYMCIYIYIYIYIIYIRIYAINL